MALDGLRLRRPTHSDGLRVSAQSMLEEIEFLANRSPLPLMPCAVLAGLAVECSLKAYLVDRFVSARKLRAKPYGHNLAALWETAAAKGLKIAKRPPAWCVALNKLTSGKFLARYHTGVHGLAFPPTKRMLRGIRKLIRLVNMSFH